MMRLSIIRRVEQESMSAKNPPPPPVLSEQIMPPLPVVADAVASPNDSTPATAPKDFKEKSTQGLRKKKKKVITPSEAAQSAGLPVKKEDSKPELIASSVPVVLDGKETTVVLAPVETKTEPPKVEEPKKTKMKRWPENPAELLPYKDIAGPLKEILTKGYRLFRKDEVKAFEYEGFNIGKQELKSQPSPRVRFSQTCLEYEKKFGANLIDVVLNVMFLMGIEQGRRAERRDNKPIESLIETLERYRERNKDLRIKIDELEVMLELKEFAPNLTNEEFQSRVRAGVAARRAKRIEELKAELKLDASKSTFQFKTPVRAKFKELEAIAKTLTKEKCSEEQWIDILSQHGWTSKEWKDKCKKKFVKTDFS